MTPVEGHRFVPARLLLPLGVVLFACAGPGAPSSPAPVADEAEWRSLARPRPEPLDGAVNVGISEVQLLGAPVWPAEAAVSPTLGLTELVAAGLLRRRDVRFVERRRFGAAAEADRSGAWPSDAPAIGTSPRVELVAVATWLPVSTSRASLEIRLTAAATGAVVLSRRRSVAAGADPVSVARAIVSEILLALEQLGRRPAWSDPVPASAPASDSPSGISPERLLSFLQGLAAEERWAWEEARASYGRAEPGDGFVEAEAALARVARVRLGGTLGES